MSNSEKIHTYTSEPDSFASFLTKIWHYKSLIYVFAKRDLKVKYAQTFIGLGWTLIQPFTSLMIYTLFFGFILNWKVEGIEFPVYVLSGLLGWNYFSYTVNAGTFGLQESAGLIKKVYFPKSIIPFSKMLIAFVELAISMLLLIPLIIYFGQEISWKIVLMPFVLLFNTICSLALVFWISIFAIKKRDILHLIPFILYFGIWFSPVFFSNEILPTQYAFIIDLNPMANVIEAWRWCMFNFGEFKWIWIVNFGITTLLLLGGMFIYNRRESSLLDNL